MKQSPLGPRPQEWEIKQLGDVFTLKNGYSFKSEFFASTGPIVLTPGNFKLSGGLYFNERNTKRYSGDFPESMIFDEGDLLIVMTDLTPDCNLLGKPAIVSGSEIILHNQRIGKVQCHANINLKFLYYLLLSDHYLKRIKEQATGSTVRHTSGKSIRSVVAAFPPIEEQERIAAALSDVDELIGALDALIAKKRDIKTAVMQQLLTGKTRLPGFGEGVDMKQTELGEIPADWEIVPVGSIGKVIRGASPRPKGDKRYYGGDIPRLMVEDVTRDGKYVTPAIDFLTKEGAKRSRPCEAGTLTIVCSGTVGVPSFLATDACIHDGFLALVELKNIIHVDFLFHFLKTQQPKFDNSATHGGVFTNLTTEILRNFLIPLPKQVDEQKAISQILNKIDEEIEAIATHLNKTQAIKQGMMQELLTGRTRLL